MTLDEKYKIVRSKWEECTQEDELWNLLKIQSEHICYDGFGRPEGCTLHKCYEGDKCEYANRPWMLSMDIFC
ncbi:hypothetical protein MKW98_025052 [Papaver atlanticum]|uniref:Uncharacterized protein n=1 Tax=Papaver atlanticum TaxID=357466 RepID=A0AAD4SZX3_9MAGN|nr:hypothetical protein MKW98_025052 [Papaver atlanticum]